MRVCTFVRVCSRIPIISYYKWYVKVGSLPTRVASRSGNPHPHAINRLTSEPYALQPPTRPNPQSPGHFAPADRQALECVFKEETEEKQAAATAQAAADRRLQHKREAKLSLTIEEAEALAQATQSALSGPLADPSPYQREEQVSEQACARLSVEEKRTEKKKLNNILDFHFGRAGGLPLISPGRPPAQKEHTPDAPFGGDTLTWLDMPSLIH